MIHCRRAPLSSYLPGSSGSSPRGCIAIVGKSPWALTLRRNCTDMRKIKRCNNCRRILSVDAPYCDRCLSTEMVYRSGWYVRLTNFAQDCFDFVGSIFNLFMYITIRFVVLWGIVALVHWM